MKIEISNLTKSYQEKVVLNHLNLTLTDEQPICLMSPSGSGKTTFLRLLLGLEQPDRGEIRFFDGQDSPLLRPRFSAVFQENRLCEAFSPVENVRIAAGAPYDAKAAREELLQLIPKDCLNQPVYTFSGGMKRRTAICRAMIAPSRIVLMDEPFTGLDEKTRNLVIRYVLGRLNGRMLVVATHQEVEAERLGGRVVNVAIGL